MKKLIITVLISLFCFGCINPTIQTTKNYEGHFYTAQEAKDAVQNMTLNDGESVWILSNITLKRVLKNTK